MSAIARPPRLALRLLTAALPWDEREPISGDLLEVFDRICAVRGVRRARVWYWSQALSFSVRFVVERMRARPSRRREQDPEGEVVAAYAWRGGAWPPVGTRLNRKQRMVRMMEAWARDFAQAARTLARSPGFTLVTVATLALAIGANTAIFSVIDTVLLDPLAYPEPDRLVSIRATAPGSDLPEEFGVGTEFYVQYRENASALEDLGLYNGAQTTVRYDEADRVERLFIAAVSPSMFSTLRVTPILGRLPTDDDPEGTVIVLSHWLWTEWFARDPAVLGKQINVSNGNRTVIGVMGPDFAFPEERISLWVHDLPTEPIRPGGFGLGLVGRLAPGATIESLTEQLGPLAQRLPERFGGSPQYRQIIERHRPVVRSLEEQLVGNIAAPLWVLLGTVGIILLIACANVANLLIARAEGRRRDLAVRRALGAGRGGLIRSQLTEALILAAAGGLLGVLLARLGVPLLVRAAPESIPRLATAGLDPAVFAFTAGVVIVAALLSGLLPAIRFSNPGLAGVRDSHRIASGPDNFTRNALVVVQTAAALVLLVGSGLLLKSFMELSRVDAGYDTEDIFTFQAAPDARARGLVNATALAQFHYDFLDRLSQMPGVESVGLVNTLPLDEGAGVVPIVTDETAASSDEAQQPLLRYTMVGGDYFQTMGIVLQRGRYFERRAQPIADPGVIVSEAAAKLLWPRQEALGRRLARAADPTAMLTVIGVVEDIFLQDFRQQAPDPMIYLPMVGRTATEWGVGTPAYVVRTPRAEIIAPEIREVLREIAPEAPMYRIFTMAQLAARASARLSFTMVTLAVAAGLALILGAVGLYGVLSYVVSRRTREIGIRMALGAQATELRRMVVAQGSRVTLIGVLIGIVAALASTRVLDTLLFGVGAMDITTFAIMSLLMIAVAVLASYIPARRASTVDPMKSLRAE